MSYTCFSHVFAETHGKDRNGVITIDGDSADAQAQEPAEPKFSEQWWADHFTEEDQYRMELSGKISLLYEVLTMCENIGDKV